VAPPASRLKREEAGNRLPAFFVSAEVFFLQFKPRERWGFFLSSLGNVGMPRAVASSSGWDDDSENSTGAVAQVTAPDACTRHPWPSETERTDARLYHRCRDGAWSGRCMGGSGAARRLRSEAVAREGIWRGQPSHQPARRHCVFCDPQRPASAVNDRRSLRPSHSGCSSPSRHGWWGS
jgi:hypothetical protein